MPRILAERWTPCPEGELDRLQASLRTGRFRQLIGTILLAVVAALAVAGAGYSVANAFWPGPSSSMPQNPGAPCSQPPKP
jgi:hypothetical protein